MIKKIKFIPDTQEAKHHFGYPVPAKKVLPNWWKKANRYTYGDKSPGISRDSLAPNTTFKACMPFRDALTTGYVWTLPADIEIRNYNNILTIKWIPLKDLIDEHSFNQIENLPLSVESHTNQLFKFVSNFSIKTPKGYSTLFTHPLNRHDLPFRTFSGVVDTDKYNIAVSFPFAVTKPIREDEILIIEKGTPVIQFIPIKRNHWIKQNLDNISIVEYEKKVINIFSKISNSYRKQFWVRKQYE